MSVSVSMSVSVYVSVISFEYCCTAYCCSIYKMTCVVVCSLINDVVRYNLWWVLQGICQVERLILMVATHPQHTVIS